MPQALCQMLHINILIILQPSKVNIQYFQWGNGRKGIKKKEIV